MADFICPVCKKRLVKRDNSYKCENNHSFDISRKGYVNLFQGKNGSKNHGDDKAMIKARTSFLDGGFYEGLREGVCALSDKYTGKNPEVVDCGCGECYYTAGIFETLSKSGKSPSVAAVDISKDAVMAGAKRCKELKLAVASVFHLPFESESFDLLVTLFAPFCREEYLRVLKKGGVMIMAIPLENHLWELKQAVYDTPYKNIPQGYEIEGFELIESLEIRRKLKLDSNEQIQALFEMTPYCHKTSPEDIAKLSRLSNLEVSAEFSVLAYRKCGLTN